MTTATLRSAQARLARLETIWDAAQYDANDAANCDQSRMSRSEVEAIRELQRNADRLWNLVLEARSRVLAQGGAK